MIIFIVLSLIFCLGFTVAIYFASKDPKDGIFLASFYVEGKGKLVDFIAKKILAKKGFFTLPFDSEESIKERLSKDFEVEFFGCPGALIYFCARKVR